MAKSKHFAKANFLWTNVAYCDQWEKVMAVYDERDNLRAVVKETANDSYDVLLIGDDENVALYEFNGIELGSTGKNMDACFKIYCRLQYESTPSYIPSYRRAERVELYQIFPHTRVSARRTGGFRVTTEDLSERIAKALERYNEITTKGVTTFDCTEEYEECDDYDGFPIHIYNEYGQMHHVGDGAYCDDDGDNWDFF